jgi:hypothetical protein
MMGGSVPTDKLVEASVAAFRRPAQRRCNQHSFDENPRLGQFSRHPRFHGLLREPYHEPRRAV